MKETFDLLISHNQIRLSSKNYDENYYQWGKKNVEQGLVLHPGLIIVDPLSEGSFGAFVNIIFTDKFTLDNNAQRAIEIPFTIFKKDELEVSSVSEAFKVNLEVPEKKVKVIYEVCVGDEIYYNFTVIDEVCDHPTPVISDGWGLEKGKKMDIGYAN